MSLEGTLFEVRERCEDRVRRATNNLFKNAAVRNALQSRLHEGLDRLCYPL